MFALVLLCSLKIYLSLSAGDTKQATFEPSTAFCVKEISEILKLYSYPSRGLPCVYNHCHPLVQPTVAMHDRIFGILLVLIASSVGMFIAITLGYRTEINPKWKFFGGTSFVVLLFGLWTGGRFFRTVLIGEHIEDLIEQLPEKICPRFGQDLVDVADNFFQHLTVDRSQKDITVEQKCAVYFYQFDSEKCKPDVLATLTAAASIGSGLEAIWKKYLADRHFPEFERTEFDKINPDGFTLMYHFDSVVVPCVLTAVNNKNTN